MRIFGAVLGAVSAAALAQTAPLVVTPDNFRRAETDTYFATFAKRGGFGKFHHLRDLPLEGTGVRPNRDTLYSQAVFDLDAGPVTITTPDPGKRFMSLMIVDQDHYARDVFYGKGARTLDRRRIGTRYVFAALRTLVDPESADDLQQARALQDATTVSQKAPGKLELPAWDPVSHKKVRDALLALSATLPDLRKAFGRRDQVDPVRHLIGTAAAWGGNPDKDALYLNVTPGVNDGRTVYRLTVPASVPVDAFWSVTVYDAAGHFRKNSLGAYSLNSITARKSAEGTVTIQFGGCNDRAPNCLPTMDGWNYMVRLYRPRSEVLEGKWQFPAAVQRGDGLGRGLRG